MTVLLSLYRWFMARPVCYRLNLHIYKLALRGLGVLNAEGSQVTGERWFFQQLQRVYQQDKVTVIDVGANTGTYTEELLEYLPQAQVTACEPHPATFATLKNTLKKSRSVKLENVAVSRTPGRMTLWDFAQDAPLKHTQPTSTLSSLNKSVIEELHHQPSQGYAVKVVTLDQLAKKHHLRKIQLVKIDTEGFEYQVLEGARELIGKGNIEIIQFEFNEMQVYTKTFVRDILQLLPGYTLYRLLPGGAVALGEYRPLTHEIFGFQNLIAVAPGVKLFGTIF